jgi:ribosome-binding protein aMBF1 (putative translation factor)
MGPSTCHFSLARGALSTLAARMPCVRRPMRYRFALNEVVMYAITEKRAPSEKSELRKEAGRWLKDRREARGLSQRELAELVGVEYYTFVSQLETGRGRIPSDKYRAWAEALGMSSRDFVLALLPFYEPTTYSILFPNNSMGGETAE